MSKQSAKKGGISDLLYDTIQQEKLLLWCKTGRRSMQYTIEASLVSDCGQRDIDAALDEQTLDLDAHHSQDDIDISVDEAS